MIPTPPLDELLHRIDLSGPAAAAAIRAAESISQIIVNREGVKGLTVEQINNMVSFRVEVTGDLAGRILLAMCKSMRTCIDEQRPR